MGITDRSVATAVLGVGMALVVLAALTVSPFGPAMNTPYQSNQGLAVPAASSSQSQTLSTMYSIVSSSQAPFSGALNNSESGSTQSGTTVVFTTAPLTNSSGTIADNVTAVQSALVPQTTVTEMATTTMNTSFTRTASSGVAQTESLQSSAFGFLNALSLMALVSLIVALASTLFVRRRIYPKEVES